MTPAEVTAALATPVPELGLTPLCAGLNVLGLGEVVMATAHVTAGLRRFLLRYGHGLLLMLWPA